MENRSDLKAKEVKTDYFCVIPNMTYIITAITIQSFVSVRRPLIFTNFFCLKKMLTFFVKLKS